MTNEFMMVIFTALLFVATTFLFFATQSLVKNAEDTARRQLRAYVHVKGVRLIDEPVIPGSEWKELRIEVLFHNFGQCPATELEYWLNFGVHEFPLHTSLLEEHVQRIAVISPHDTFTIKIAVPLIDAPENQRFALYVFGHVRYFDGFQGGRETHLRYMRRGSDDWSWEGEFELCQEGNHVT